MATIHRLNSDWTLTDGIIDPVRLDRPRTIYDALRRDNLVPDARFGMNAAACEWIGNRTFIYEKKFDLPPSNDTERTELHFESMQGDCTVCVNGRKIAPFGKHRYDITAAARETDNNLQVIYAPSAVSGIDAMLQRGISGGVSIMGTNRITIDSADFSAADGNLRCALVIDAHISGKYHFTCVLSRDGEAIATHEIHKRLIAAEQPVDLSFPLPEGAPGTYDVLLTIELNGLLCDRLRECVSVMTEKTPEAVCHFTVSDEEAVLTALPQIKAAGFNAVSFTGKFPRRIRTRLQELNLPLTQADDAPLFTGCMDADTLRKYADGRRCWPADAPVWKLRGDHLPADLPYATAFGNIDRKNADLCTAAIRLLQAQNVFDHIICARKAGMPACIGTQAISFPHFVSASLWDESTPRPALYAAKQALQPMIAVADVPEGPLPCGVVLKFPVTLLARKDVRPLPVTVTATMYAPDGSILSGTSFAAVPQGAKLLGELNCELPRGIRHALLRTVVENPDAVNVVTEKWITCGDEPMTPAALPKAFIADGKNGAALAYGVVTESGIRHLLPNETVEGFTGEYFNR